jgi:VWFA-related protein
MLNARAEASPTGAETASWNRSRKLTPVFWGQHLSLQVNLMPSAAKVSLLLAFFAVLPSWAQSNQDVINLDVVVTSGSGAPVTDLQQSDFTVHDNKVQQQISSFRALGPQDPVRITIVLDAVNVPYTDLAYQEGEVKKYLLANEGQLAVPTALVIFTDHGMQPVGSFTQSGQELNEALSHQDVGLRDIRRSSQFEMQDRLNISLNGLRALMGQEAQIPGRKMILWVSPGWPLLSGPRIDLSARQQDQLFGDIRGISTAMTQAQIILYNVNPFGAMEGVGRALYYQDFLKPVTKPGQAQLADLSLQVLATQSGGLVLTGSNDVTGLLQRCAREALATYQISYTPTATKGETAYHPIQVLVNNPKLKARTRQGYYLPTAEPAR